MASSKVPDIKLLLVGKTGEGKSSTGNSILGKRKFKTGGDFTSATKDCETGQAEVEDHGVMVVDTPGLADPDFNCQEDLERIIGQIKTALKENSDGFDAILIVTRYGNTLTEEDTKVFEKLEAVFGTGYAENHGILVVTCADNYEPEDDGDMTIEEVLHTLEGPFKVMKEKCDDRLVIFDNKSKDESVQQKQKKSLVDKVVEMTTQPLRYKQKNFEKAEKSRVKALFKGKTSSIRKETPMDIEEQKSKSQGATASIKSTGVGTDSLHNIIHPCLSSLEGAVRARKASIAENQDVSAPTKNLSESDRDKKANETALLFLEAVKILVDYVDTETK